MPRRAAPKAALLARIEAKTENPTLYLDYLSSQVRLKVNLELLGMWA